MAFLSPVHGGFDFLCAFVQRRLKCCSLIPKIIVRVTFNGWIWKDSTGVEMHKMKGDFYRYLVEFATCETKSKAGEDACVACAEATKIADKDLVVTHLVRLAMALTSSVFQYEVLPNPDDIAGGVHVGENDLDDVPVVTQRQIPMVQRTRTLQCMDKVVDNLVVQVPRMQVVEKTVEIPQLQTVEKPAETPQTQTIQGTQTSESLGITSVCQVAQAGHVEVVDIGTPFPYRIRITHVRLSTSSAGCGGTGSDLQGFLSGQGSTAFWRTNHRTPYYFTR